MSLDYCPICGEFLIWSNHTCEPSFFVFSDGDAAYWDIKTNSESRKYFAKDEEEAAIKYCQHDYETPNELDVLVISTKEWYNILEDCEDKDVDETCKTMESKMKKFQMSSEIHRDFYASEVK